MLKNIPSSIEDEMFQHMKTSLENGLAVRRLGFIWTALLVGSVLLIMAITHGLSSEFFLALTLATSSLCVIWAIYSVSASLNMQCDLITRLIAHYGESKNSKLNP